MSTRGNPWQALDSAWFYPGSESDDGLAIAMFPLDDRIAAPLFTSREGAAPLLERLPPGAGLLQLEAGDWRAKEEWLRAASLQGCSVVAIDLDPTSLEPTSTLVLELALGHVLSQKRATACL